MSEHAPLGDTTTAVAVWPCDHGGVQVEPGPAKTGYSCHVCGAVASTYLPADEFDRYRKALESIRDGEWNAAGARQVASVALNPEGARP